jgi:hypothetical protein
MVDDVAEVEKKGMPGVLAEARVDGILHWQQVMLAQSQGPC